MGFHIYNDVEVLLSKILYLIMCWGEIPVVGGIAQKAPSAIFLILNSCQAAVTVCRWQSSTLGREE